MRRGGCLCGGVGFTVEGDLADPVACHCSQCARTSGHVAVMAACRSDELRIAPADTLAWYRSSDAAERGFCARCGGNLFWKPDAGELVYVAAGALDRPTGLSIAEHIFVASKSDYYEIRDGLPQKQEW